MNTKIAILFFTIITFFFATSFSKISAQQKGKTQEKAKRKETIGKESKDKTKTIAEAKIDTVQHKAVGDFFDLDTLKLDVNSKLKFYKKNAHASYYHNKFNGRRTASGKKFDNNKYTAAHKKLPFGTIVKVTNEANGKSIIVEITDRGPFTKAREIDLSRRAFMALADNKKSGVVIVKIEVVE